MTHSTFVALLLFAIFGKIDGFVKGGVFKVGKLFCDNTPPTPPPTKLSIESISELFNTYRNSIKTVSSLLIEEHTNKKIHKKIPPNKITPIMEETSNNNSTTISQIHRNIITKNVIMSLESDDITNLAKMQIIKQYGWLIDNNTPPLTRGGLLHDWNMTIVTELY